MTQVREDNSDRCGSVAYYVNHINGCVRNIRDKQFSMYEQQLREVDSQIDFYRSRIDELEQKRRAIEKEM